VTDKVLKKLQERGKNAIMRECYNGRIGIQGNWKKNWQISNLRLQISNKYQIQKFKPVLQVEYLGFEQLRFICFLRFEQLGFICFLLIVL